MAGLTNYEIKQFIEENKSLINENTPESWKQVYENTKNLSTPMIGKFTRMLLDIGIDPASVMGYIPVGYLNKQADIDYKIPNNVTTISRASFFGCNGLTDIVIPNKVLAIGDGAFEHCEGLRNVTIGDKVEYIGNSAFSMCTNLEQVIIPNSVEIISGWAFSSCENLSRIFYTGTVEQWLHVRRGVNVFMSTNNFTVKCIDGSL